MIQAIILAAGQGTRMYSDLPKVLHPLAGRPLLEHVICTAQYLSPTVSPIVIYGHQGDALRHHLGHYEVQWIEQKEQLGTGHALMQALPKLAPEANVLVLYGDVPLISEQTLRQLIDKTPDDSVGMLTATLDHPTGYGRIKRDAAGNIIAIVEEKDATEEERQICEINPGIYLIPAKYLNQWLPKLSNDNAQGEYYLTDIIVQAVKDNVSIHAVQPFRREEILGVNDRLQLHHLERYYQKQYAEKLMRQGVTVCDASRLDIRGELSVGRDVVIDVNVVIEGRVVIGNGCMIGPNTLLRNVQLGERVEIKANTVIDGAEIAGHCVIGPFARIRPGTILSQHVHIGNFVEIKNSDIAENTKVNHLSYIGDAVLGKFVNIGAGTITCNYDGANKHKTIIGDHVHIGSDTQLVAPVTVGQGATIGAGSTIVKDVEAGSLTLTQKIEQRSKKDWTRPAKAEKTI